MPALPPESAVYPVQHLPIIKAYADQLGLVSLINHYVPTEMDVDAGTIVLGLVLDTLSGRSPLYRLEEFFAHQDTELLLGKALPPHAFTDDRSYAVVESRIKTGIESPWGGKTLCLSHSGYTSWRCCILPNSQRARPLLTRLTALPTIS
jgi:hypothetical protein